MHIVPLIAKSEPDHNIDLPGHLEPFAFRHTRWCLPGSCAASRALTDEAKRAAPVQDQWGWKRLPAFASVTIMDQRAPAAWPEGDASGAITRPKSGPMGIFPCGPSVGTKLFDLRSAPQASGTWRGGYRDPLARTHREAHAGLRAPSVPRGRDRPGIPILACFPICIVSILLWSNHLCLRALSWPILERAHGKAIRANSKENYR